MATLSSMERKLCASCDETSGGVSYKFSAQNIAILFIQLLNYLTQIHGQPWKGFEISIVPSEHMLWNWRQTYFEKKT